MAKDKKHIEDEEEGIDGFTSEDTPENKARLTDAFKKILTVGLGAAFMTEESIRKYLGEIKLPKEVLGFLLESAKSSKEELMNRVGREVIGMVRKIDVVAEASRFVENHKFKISAEIEVLKKTDSSNAGEETDIKIKL